MNTDKPKQAVERFKNGFNCSQAIIATYCDEFGLDANLAFQLASGFGGGMGRLCETCGAISGAYMVLGLKFGNYAPGDPEGKERVYSLIREFTRRFKERNNATRCEDLIGTHLLTGDKDFAKERTKIVCPKMVRDASEILDEMLNAKS